MKYTLQQADDLARQLKKTRKGRKFLKNLLNFHEQWQDFVNKVAADSLHSKEEKEKPVGFPDSLKYLAEVLDSDFQTSKKDK